MVSLVLVSHSKLLAEATLMLVRAMVGEEVNVATAAGAGEDGNDLGTDAMAILEAINSVMNDDGVLVMMDMGSAVLSAEMAMDFLDDDAREKVKLCASPFVEGAVAGAVAAKIGRPIEDVIMEASMALNQKKEHIGSDDQPETSSVHIDLQDAERVVVKIRMPNGLHARPVSKLVQEAALYKSEIQIKDVTNGKGPVSVKSITGVIALEALKGHEVELTAKGEDQTKALADLKAAIEGGLGDPVEHDDAAGETQIAPPAVDAPAATVAIGICKGVVIAPIYRGATSEIKLPDALVSDVEKECDRLKQALHNTEAALKEKAKEVAGKTCKSDGEIFLAQATMIADPELLTQAVQGIRSEKYQAPKAWWVAVNKAIDTYRALSNDNLRQRALDLQDVAYRVLEELGVAVNSALDIPEKGILMVDDLTPGQVAAIDKDKVLGVICMENGQTSHSAILLRSRAIPSIVQACHLASSLRAVPEGTVVAMDGATSEVFVNPPHDKLAEMEKRRADWMQQVEAEKKESLEDAFTADGVRIEVFANVGSVEDAVAAAANGAEGIGLLRTEFLFLHRDSAPTEEEQVKELAAILEPMHGRPVIIRTLDAGGDKELPYLNMPAEANPFLGVRAIRLTLRRPELFQLQLRAILRVAKEYDLRVMFPMISKIDELRQAKAALLQAHESLLKEQVPHKWPVVTGMMMEVPSAAIMADDFAKEVDFMSIGTNDLVQYTMAADRGNPALQQPSANGFDPAVVRLIDGIGKACLAQRIPVAVCGESASNPLLAATLLKCGVSELSMNPGSIAEIKYWLRRQSLKDLKG